MRETIPSFPGAVDGVTGELLSAPSLEETARLLADLLPESRRKREVLGNPFNLTEVGWGLIFAESDTQEREIREALDPLLKRRKCQAGARYREYLGQDGYRANEDKLTFLARHKAGPGPVDPSRVPYYFLLVGSPEQIPYEFQYGLDLHHAVGRICFEKPEQYASYAASLVAAEIAAERSPKRVAFFGPLQDEGTRLSNEGLLSPLIGSLRGRPDCQVLEVLGEDATKTRLTHLLGGEETPDLLFTAGHGVFYGCGHERQQTHQGALVCQGWPGKGPAEPEHVFAAEDLNGGTRLRGLLAFLFACNSAGTPAFCDFASGRLPASPRPFVSRLAQRLLGHPKGGALAVVGHVEQVWRCSFLWREAGYLPAPFIEVVRRLLEGAPLGWAMEPLGQRFADLAASRAELLDMKSQGYSVDEQALAALQTASRDARNYVIVGDPAVRLAGAPAPEAPKKPVMRG